MKSSFIHLYGRPPALSHVNRSTLYRILVPFRGLTLRADESEAATRDSLPHAPLAVNLQIASRGLQGNDTPTICKKQCTAPAGFDRRLGTLQQLSVRRAEGLGHGSRSVDRASLSRHP